MQKNPVLPLRSHESWRKLDLSGLDIKTILNSGASSSYIDAGNAAVLRRPEALEQKFVQQAFEAVSNGNLSSLRVPSLFNQLHFLNPRAMLAIEVAEGQPLFIKHILEQGDWLATRLVLHVLANREVTIVEEVSSNGRLLCPVTDIIAEAGAKINYVALSLPGSESYYFHNFRAKLFRDASLRLYYFHSGGARGKNYYECCLTEPGSEFQATAVALGQGRQMIDLEMRLYHQASHSSSSIEYRTVLGGRSHSIFNGNLQIAKELKQVASHQTNHNIILNKKARAESMPNLLIKAESVSCEHGATVGQLDRGALLYLMSRGIPEAEARALLVQGFLAEVIEKIPEPESQVRVQQIIAETLPAMQEEK